MKKLNYEEIIERDGKYIFSPEGTSMLPLIRRKRDTVLVEKKTSRLKKRDVALYKRQNGEYVLHRVLKVEKDGYTFCGDNHVMLEKGVPEESVFAVMTSLWRDEKQIKTTDFSYKFYSFVWCMSLFLRRILLKIIGKRG